MLKIYLVDDDLLIIKELISIIKWNNFGFEVCGYSTNPEKALEEIKNYNPDLIISDIQMDGLSGLELAEKIKQSNCNASFFFLSAYDNFDYAVKAIRIGVARYLTKPIIKAEIEESLSELWQKKSIEFNQEIFKYLSSSSNEILNKISDIFNDSNFIMNDKAFYIADFKSSKIDDCLKELNKVSDYFYCFYSDLCSASVIIYGLKYEKFLSIFSGKNDISIGISNQKKDFTGLAQLIKRVRLLSQNKFLTNKCEINQIKDNTNYNTICNMFASCNDQVELKILIKNLKQIIIENDVQLYYFQKIYIAIIYALFRLNVIDFDESLLSCVSILSFYNSLDELIAELLSYFNNDPLEEDAGQIIDKVKSELNNNIDKKLTLSYFAVKYGYNISYFSQLFKNVEGISFAKYFINLKMDKAKKLIIHSNNTLQNIALTVGYDDYYHFSKTFKKYTSYSPTDFKIYFQNKK